jgi:hypothetical protein
MEIYVTTYGEANLVAVTNSEMRRRVHLHSAEAMAHHPTGIAVNIVGIVRPAIMADAVRSKPIADMSDGILLYESVRSYAV